VNALGPILTIGVLGVTGAVAYVEKGLLWYVIAVLLTLIVGGTPFRPPQPPGLALDVIDKILLGLRSIWDLALAPVRFFRAFWPFAARRPWLAAILSIVWTGAVSALCVCLRASLRR
jgi:hypothetical protein